MGKILVKNQTEPDTPPAGLTAVFIDPADKHLKIKDDTGTVTDLSASASPPKPPIRLSYADGATKTNSSVYTPVAFFGFDGTTELGTPTAIKAVIRITGATSGSIRVFDETNSNVIAELTGFTEGVPTIKDLGTLSNLPTGPAVFSIQLLRIGTGGQTASVHAMSIKF